MDLDLRIAELLDIFKENSRYEAHKKVKSILIDMAQNKGYLEEIIKRNVCQKSFFKQSQIFQMKHSRI